MNLQHFVFFFLSSLLLSGCLEKPCKTHEFCPQPETAVRYFSVYKPGSWWVYETSDGSKRDSIYVSEYRVESGQDREDPCFAWEDVDFTCVSDYFTDEGNFVGRYGNAGNCSSSDFRITLRKIGLTSFSERDTLLSGLNGAKSLKQFKLPFGLDTVYSEVTLVDDIKVRNADDFVFAMDVGLIRFCSPNLDTFYLTEYFIP
ncbi:MAG TPA: hypothetical protein DDX92_03175 [Flavobacteriales bacterium]|jgi:hypothetical protein|nr:hypothetical protein [Flavobacteriales bacterium]